MIYVALLRGINVGGNTLIKMSELRECVSKLGFKDVKTYINSGNIIFRSDETDTGKLAEKIEQSIAKNFSLNVPVVVLSQPQLKKVIENVPAKWGSDSEWKYNYFFLLHGHKYKKIIEDIGELKPEIETLDGAEGVVYQTVSFKKFGSSRSGKIASMPVYKFITVRNNRTPLKILAIMDEYDRET